MKRKICLLLAAALLVSLLAGCRQAAEPETVTEKDQDSILSAVQPGSGDASSLDHLELPEKFTGDWTGLEDCFHVHADASVTLPGVSQIPTATVTRKPFSQEDADKLMEVFLKGNTLYQEVNATKQSAMEDLEKMKAALRGEIPLSDVTVDHTMEELPGMIERREEEIKTLPDESELPFPAPTTFQPETWCDEIMKGYADVDGKKMHIFLYNDADWTDEAIIWQEEYGDTNSCHARYLEEMAEKRELSMSQEEALKMGDALLESLGIDYAVCGSSKPVVYIQYDEKNTVFDTGYELEYVRVVNGFPITQNRPLQHNADGSTFLLPAAQGTSTPDGASDGIWGYELLTVYVTKDGVVYFDWRNPYTEPVIQEENTQLMDFSDISDIFAKMIFVKNHYWLEANQKGGIDYIHDVDVDNVQLNLMRIRDKNSLSEGTIVPVWDFWGEFSMRAADDAYQDTVFDGSYYEIVLTINAIDGTVIDRELGY